MRVADWESRGAFLFAGGSHWVTRTGTNGIADILLALVVGRRPSETLIRPEAVGVGLERDDRRWGSVETGSSRRPTLKPLYLHVDPGRR
jgi:hypothetical protein